MGKSQEFKHKTKQEAKEIADYLHNIADGISSGSLNLDNGTDQLLLNPEGTISMDLESKSDGKKCKIELELKWTQVKDSTLSISS